MNDESPSGPPRREDPRLAQTRDLVLQAARMIIAADGHGAVTPTRLVEVSGVARSTIYRHWDDADAVIADALAVDRQETQLHSSGDPATDLRSYLEQLRAMLDAPAATIVVTQAEVAERNEQAAETLAANGRHRNKLIHDLLGDPRTDFDIIHAQLVGPLFAQRFLMRKPITDDLIDAIVDAYVTGRAAIGHDDVAETRN